MFVPVALRSRAVVDSCCVSLTSRPAGTESEYDITFLGIVVGVGGLDAFNGNAERSSDCGWSCVVGCGRSVCFIDKQSGSCVVRAGWISKSVVGLLQH